VTQLDDEQKDLQAHAAEFHPAVAQHNRQTKVTGVTVECRTCDREVPGSTPGG